MQHQSVINEKTEDRKTFVVSNIVSIVSSTSKKSDQNEVHDIKDLLKCSMSSSYCQEKKASTKHGSLIETEINGVDKEKFRYA